MAEIKNRKAFFDYEILDRLTAGMVLHGSEIKSLRAGRGSFSGAFVSLKSGEAFLKNFNIQPWEFAQEKLNPERERKLLLKKQEIERLIKKTEEQGLTVIPLKLFFTRGYAKVEIALARGKRKYDKRQSIKAKDTERRAKQTLRQYGGK
ncbi:SsrA-binding protein SmpB [Candidatus Peregrinibacteria bacterium]|nr:MAG: SsrA-binding protein SmpB [Candidatus Peregrinibacteria bacterium]